MFATALGSRQNTGKTWDYIRVFLLHLEVFKAHCPLDTAESPSLPSRSLHSAWIALWAVTASSLRTFARENNTEKQCELALKAFALLDRFEERIRQAAADRSQAIMHGNNGNEIFSHPADDKLFPDELYDALSAFLPESRTKKLAEFVNIRWRRTAVEKNEMGEDHVGRVGEAPALRLSGEPISRRVDGSEDEESDQERQETSRNVRVRFA